jgi:hypothetical protein
LLAPVCLSGACVPYSAFVVVGVAEAAGDSADELDLAVVALGAGVGDAGLQGGDDLYLPDLDGVGETWISGPKSLRRSGRSRTVVV